MSETVTELVRRALYYGEAPPRLARAAEDAVAALAQQLADVAYLEAWLSADEGHRWFSRLDGAITAWECMTDGKTHIGAAVASTLPALGALLRQREEANNGLR